MDTQLPRSRFALDLLIAEAKRRMRRRRWVVALVILVVLGAAIGATLALRPWDGGNGSVAAAGHAGISQIPGMTRVNSSGVGTSVCSGSKGIGRLPHWCSALQLRDGRYEAWILTVALKQDGYRLSVPAAFASAHPGPAVVTAKWLTLASPRQALQLLHERGFTNSYAGRPAAAVNGGVARRFVNPAFLRSQDEFEFFWASGPTVVDVNVIGADLTLGQAERIALLARPR